ncbi:glycosyl transferase group 1 [Richelia sinica FACHB-800]|uniref:Glycosyl transferase group 1 n=1 Tax=Richelia sinica FACHB-800 TaxID=1357546 RepID=A0A975Y2V3_9NOST|nr:glycosyltransferase [Richelia sinica]MBD2665308.1 glycosyltransferase [Richelia sinica FACHB-800]QXE21417.1 glycosyl transferase group 1 [Richelia sinica FACHB-800]
MALRILHVFGGMVKAGSETTEIQTLRLIDRDRFQMDFLVHTTQPCAYDDEIRALGSKIIPCNYPSLPWNYDFNLKQILRNYGPYDIVHSHIHHLSGYVLRIAQQVGVPIRIAHSHLDSSPVDAQAGIYRRFYISLMKRWIACYANFRLSCSRKAAASLFGSTWETNLPCQVLYPARDFSPFHDCVDRVAVRAEFGIPADAFVIGHVGRFDPQKNHQFLIEIAAAVAQQEPKMRLLLIGEGSLRPEIEQKVMQSNLADSVIFAGLRSDVPRLMLGAMDILLFPSFYEGLASVIYEAQSAGLPCVFSDTITEEVDVVKPLLHRMALSQPASTWADVILAHRNTLPRITQAEALRLVEQSQFNIQIRVQALENTYLQYAADIASHKKA